MMRYSQNCYTRVETFKNLKGFQELDKVFVQLLNHKVKIIKLLKKKEKRMFSSNTLRSDKGGRAFYMLL